MISLSDYVGVHLDSKDWTLERQENATKLLEACGGLELIMIDDGINFLDNPHTGSNVSGETFGGFRPQNCPQGAPNSSHKEGLAVDRYDPTGAIDEWMMNNQDKFAEYGIYIEHPSATNGWSHWTIRAPGSGHRVFYP